MHSNVGGGYPDDALAFIPLHWMLNEAKDCGLVFKTAPESEPDTFKWIESARNKEGRLYNSRAGFGASYRYSPRNVEDLCNDPAAGVSVPCPKIHASVFERIDSGCNAYAPIGLPAFYATVTNNGDVLPPSKNPFEPGMQPVHRKRMQDRLWNYVWLRRLTYFATLAASAHLAVFWLFHSLSREHEYESKLRLVSESVRFVESFLPRSVHWWADWYAGNPEWFAGGLLILIVLMGIGARLLQRTTPRRRGALRSVRGTILSYPSFHTVCGWS
jgi:hypothetical protein